MSYQVQFVGLQFFYRDRGEGGGRHVLVPDGRFPSGDIPPHLFSIIVPKAKVISSDGWREEHVEKDEDLVEFTIDAFSRIALEGASKGKGTCHDAGLDDDLPSLQAGDPNLKFDFNRANTIGEIEVRKGTLRAYRKPGSSATDGNVPLIVQLDVPHKGEITIAVTPFNEWPERTIRLRPGTEIVIINSSRGGPTAGDHARVYEQLSFVPCTVKAPRPVPARIPVSSSKHLFFQSPKAAITGDCSIQGGPP